MLSAAIPSEMLGGVAGGADASEDDGLGWGGQRGPMELSGQMLRERMCRNLSGLIAGKLETLQLGN